MGNWKNEDDMQPVSENREIKRDTILEMVKAKLRGVPSRREELILGSLMDIVSELPEDCESEEEQQLWVKNQFLKLQGRMELLAECMSIADAAKFLDRKSHALYMRIERGTLLAIKHGKDYYIPRWQFDLSSSNQLVIGFDQVLENLQRSADDPATFKNKILWLNRPWGGFDGQKPIDVLRAGRVSVVMDYLQSIGGGHR